MDYKDIDEMTSDEWLAYRRDKIDAFYELGNELIPTVGCSQCDVENDYVCFDCECNQLGEK
jgi:hypothetical protein